MNKETNLKLSILIGRGKEEGYILKEELENLNLTNEILEKVYLYLKKLDIKVETFDTIMPTETELQSLSIISDEEQEVSNSFIDLDDIARIYINEIRKIPLLSYEEEVELAQKIELGDVNARNKLIESNLRFVVSMSNRFAKGKKNILDYIQEGNIGLMKAVDKYDWRKGNRFSTYALWWIKRYLISYSINSDRLIQIPIYTTKIILNYNNAFIKLSQILDREPSIDEVASELGMPVEKLKIFLTAMQEVTSLDGFIGQTTDISFSETIIDNTIDVEGKVIIEILSEIVLNNMHNLKENEIRVLSLRYGLNDGIYRTLAEVGKILNLSRERVRQIEEKALIKMKNFLK